MKRLLTVVLSALAAVTLPAVSVRAQTGAGTEMVEAPAEPSPSPAPTATPSATLVADPTPTPEATPAPDDASSQALPQLDSVDPAIQPTSVPGMPSSATGAEPPLAPGEEALPPLEGGFPGDDAIFGSESLGVSALPGANLRPSRVIPPRPVLAPDSAEEARKMRIRFREAKIVADRDPAVQEMWQLSETAKTDEDKRAALRAYYRLLFSRVRKIDPKLKAYTEPKEAAALALLAQTRVDPTVPLNPPPLPEPTPPRKKKRAD